MGPAECEEIQRNEIQALQSIFPDEFQLHEGVTKVVWNKTAVPAFHILVNLRDEDISQSPVSSVLPSIELHVQFSSLYPKTAPKLELLAPQGLLKADVELLRRTLESSVKKLLGSEMIYDLVDILKSHLKTFSQTTNETLSLIDERTNRMQESHAIRTALEEDRAQSEARIKAEQEAAMQSRIEEELRLKTKSRTYSSHTKRERTKIISSSTHITFSRSITIGFYTLDSLFLGVPIVQNDLTATRPWLSFVPEIGQLVVKQYSIDSSKPETLRAVESAVAKIDKSQMTREVDIGVENYGSSLQRADDNRWTLYVVQQYATKGSLEDLLCTVGHLSNMQAKRWLVDLAEQLSAAHRNGIIHRHIHASKVLLFEMDGRIVAKFADWEYSYLIHKQDVYFEANRLALSNNREPRPSGRRPDDIADLGVVFLEMLFGTSLRTAKSIEQYLKDAETEIEPNLHSFLTSFFARDTRQRPTASDLLTSEHLRLVDPDALTKIPRYGEINQISSLSRYHLDFEELSKIGQGGYGTVVKARNRLDGRVYAIKKIFTTTESRVLREVSGLARLNHPSIVRYFASWVERTETSDRSVLADGTTISSAASSSSSSSSYFEDEFEEDDFMSSSGVIFASLGSPETGTRNRSSTKNKPRRSISVTENSPRMLFIQMEYCSGETLRLLIDDRHIGQLYWNYFAQIVEGVMYVHGQGLIHRDLKPSNIFISRDGQLKLGDFGLAIESATEAFQGGTSIMTNDERTGDVGTFLYQAPELSLQHPVYDAKVDLYALGIIFGELICEWSTGMERINILRGLRSSSIINPLNATRQPKEVAILEALLTHDPTLRPTAVQLAAMLPPVVHKSYVKDTLKLLNEDQAFKSNVLANLFSRTSSLTEFTYDVHQQDTTSDMSLVMTQVIETLTRLFRRHGAIDRSSSFRTTFPLNNAYQQKTNVVTLLDQEANVLQLPYDLKVPFARHIARHRGPYNKSYLINPVYRSGDPCPRVLLEADFDLVTTKPQAPGDFGIETLRIAQEIVHEFPQLDGSMRVSIGHSAILRAILSQARVSSDDIPRISAMLNQLTSNVKRQSASSWKKNLATAMSESSLQELIRFMPDYSLDFDAGLSRTISLLEQETDDELNIALEQVKSFYSSATSYHINVPFYFQAFPHSSSTFELSYTLEYENRELLCVGGHYSRLVEQQKLPNQTQPSMAAAGFCLSVDKICRLVAARPDQSDVLRHVDVVVHAYAHEQQAIDLVVRLWDSKIAAEVCNDEDLLSFCNERRALFAISFREKRGGSSTQQVLRVRNLDREESEEVSMDLVVSYLIGELTETAKKQQRDISSVPRLVRSASSRKEPEVIIVSTDEHRKMKLPQRQLIASKATELVQDLTNELKGAEIPILIVDFELEQMTQLRSFDPRNQDESAVRKILDKLAAMPRAHFFGVREQITKLQDEGHSRVFLFSFRCTELLLVNI